MAGNKKIALMAAIAMAGHASGALAAPDPVSGIATNRTALAISSAQQRSGDGECRATDGTLIECADADAGSNYLSRNWPVLLGAVAAASLGVAAAVSNNGGAPASP